MDFHAFPRKIHGKSQFFFHALVFSVGSMENEHGKTMEAEEELGKGQGIAWKNGTWSILNTEN